MAFIEKGQEIDIEAIKAATQLSPEALRKKEARDRELAAIISGEDDRILLVMGLALLTMKKQFSNTLVA